MLKSTLTLLILLPLTSMASSIQLTGKTFGKSTGEIEVKLRLTNSDDLYNESVPKTERIVDYDNGQFVSASCVTSASFENVASLEIEATLNEDHQFAFESGSLSAYVSNSYSIDESQHLCDTSSLVEVRKAVLAGRILNPSMPIMYEGVPALLELNLFELLQLNEVNVSGDENRMSFDGMNLEAFRRNGIRLYYQIVRRAAGSVSTLEAGWLTLATR